MTKSINRDPAAFVFYATRSFFAGLAGMISKCIRKSLLANLYRQAVIKELAKALIHLSVDTSFVNDRMEIEL